MTTRFDHVSIATHKAQHQALPLRDHLHGRPGGTHVTDAFIATTWHFDRGIKMEFLEPNGGGEANFVRRFLSRHGEMFHHLTFKVSDLDAFLERARSIPLSMLDRSNPQWQEVFLLPARGPATLIQVVETGEPADAGDEAQGCAISGVHLTPQDYDFTLAFFTECLEATLTTAGDAAALDWPGGSTIYLHRPAPGREVGITRLTVECAMPSPPPAGAPWLDRVTLEPLRVG